MKILVKYLGYILIISAFFRIVPIASALAYGESPATFIATFLISLLLGAWLLHIDKKMKSREKTLTLTHGLMLVALSFIILPLIGAISFLPSFGYNPLNAVFESVSGFTTTGLTLYESLDSLPRSLLIWRAETQWMGGIGIIMVFLFIFSRLRAHSHGPSDGARAGEQTSMTLYQAQGFPEKLESGFRKTVENIMMIYLGYTALGIILLLAAGMPVFDSVGMSFTSISTGGFTVRDSFYSNSLQLMVLGVMMLLGSISFIAHNKLLQRKFREFLSFFEKNVFFAILAVAVAVTLAVYTDIKVVLFQLISAFTTTGYSITDVALLPHIFIMIIMLGMIIGGGMASTAGGMKVFRVFYLLKSIPWTIRKLSSPPNAVIPLKVNKEPVEEGSLQIVQVFALCYILILIAGTAVFILGGHSFIDSSFQVTSALGTVGLQTMELAGLGAVCKAVLILAMLLGRLEIFPLLVLARKIFVRR
jgi:trk system potassium uptake protein TrkH